MSRIPHQPQTINFATKYHASSGYSSHDRGVQISFTRPRTGAGIARKPRAGPVEWIKIYISADHRHLKFNFHLFTSHSFGLLFHETKLFAVKENRLFRNLKLFFDLSGRDNLITNSQPVPKPNYVTAAKYTSNHSTVSSICFNDRDSFCFMEHESCSSES